MEEKQTNEKESVIENVGTDDNGYKVKLEKFDGPLDLLLHLIKEAKVDIKDIFISKITEQFITYVKNMQDYPSEEIGDFIELASTLVQIKSKKLLPVPPKEEEDEEDPEQKLIRRLEEYKLFKEQAEKLQQIEDTGKFYKEPEKIASSIRYELKDLSFDALLDAFAHIMHKIEIKAETPKPKEIAKDRFTVAEKISHIKDRLLTESKVTFSSLYSSDYTRSEVINTFLALLELLKMQEVKVIQVGALEEIFIEKQVL